MFTCSHFNNLSFIVVIVFWCVSPGLVIPFRSLLDIVLPVDDNGCGLRALKWILCPNVSPEQICLSRSRNLERRVALVFTYSAYIAFLSIGGMLWSGLVCLEYLPIEPKCHSYVILKQTDSFFWDEVQVDRKKRPSKCCDCYSRLRSS